MWREMTEPVVLIDSDDEEGTSLREIKADGSRSADDTKVTM